MPSKSYGYLGNPSSTVSTVSYTIPVGYFAVVTVGLWGDFTLEINSTVVLDSAGGQIMTAQYMLRAGDVILISTGAGSGRAWVANYPII